MFEPPSLQYVITVQGDLDREPWPKSALQEPRESSTAAAQLIVFSMTRPRLETNRMKKFKEIKTQDKVIITFIDLYTPKLHERCSQKGKPIFPPA